MSFATFTHSQFGIVVLSDAGNGRTRMVDGGRTTTVNKPFDEAVLDFDAQGQRHGWTIDTDGLWKLTNDALHGKRWSLAREFLDRLSRRDDYTDLFADAGSYGLPKGPFYPVVQDRIDLANARADQNYDNL